MIYLIENIIVEKYETILDKGKYNAWMWDLFNIYFLLHENFHLIDKEMLAKIIIQVSENRDILENEIIDIRSSKILVIYWVIPPLWLFSK